MGKGALFARRAYADGVTSDTRGQVRALRTLQNLQLPVRVTGCPGGQARARQFDPRKPPPRPATVVSDSGHEEAHAPRQKVVKTAKSD
jgi:hypothetical protein